nr:hypothetical protein [Amycolatopsis alba]
MNAIEDCIGDLDRRLSGSPGAKADLLTEARDGLIDAADAYRAGGVDIPVSHAVFCLKKKTKTTTVVTISSKK